MAIPGRGACAAPGGAAVRDPPGSNLSVNPEGPYSRLIDVLYHTTLGSRVMKKKKKNRRMAVQCEHTLSSVLGTCKRVKAIF